MSRADTAQLVLTVLIASWGVWMTDAQRRGRPFFRCCVFCCGGVRSGGPLLYSWKAKDDQRAALVASDRFVCRSSIKLSAAPPANSTTHG